MALPFPNIHPEIFSIPAFHVGSLAIGPLAIRWYALAYVAGILLGWFYAARLVKTPRLWGGRPPTATPAQIDDLVLWVTLGVILGGRIGYILFYMLPLADERAALAAQPWLALEVWKGGMSFHGGMLGVLTAMALFARFNRIALFAVADIVCACEPIGQFFGRLANFINGELWGRITDVPWAISFCNQTIMDASGGVCPATDAPRHPSQLYEAGLEGIALFLILRWATHRVLWLQRPGAVSGLFLIGYGVFRTLLETVRNPDPGLDTLPLGVTMGMILSIPMVLLGAWMIWRALKAPPPTAPAEAPAHEPA